jgi:competence protein ComEC
VQVYRTDINGTVVATSDGQTIKVDKKASPIKPNAPPVVGEKKHTSSNDNVTVYITRTGEKYHVYGCRSLRRSCIPIKLKDAKAQGYTPCHICNPPQ